MKDIPQEVPAPYSFRSVGSDGDTYVFTTDDEAGFVHHLFELHLARYGLAGNLTAHVLPIGNGWHRIDLSLAGDLGPDLWQQVEDDFLSAFEEMTGYERQGGGSDEGGTRVWHVVRHTVGLNA